MGIIQVELSDENHKKLNILCILYRKTQDEIINMLLEKARIPGGEVEFLIADEKNPETVKTKPKEIETKLDFLIAGD